MRRRIPWFIGLALPLLSAEVVLRIFAPSLASPAPWPSVGIETKTEYAERLVGAEVDVLFLGSSITEAAIDPTQLLNDHGISSFNGAGPYSTPIAMEQWLDRILWSLDPEVLVIGLPIWGAPESFDQDVLAQGFHKLEQYEKITQSLAGSSELWKRRGQLRELIDRGQFRELIVLDADSVDFASYTDRGHLTIYYDRVRQGNDDSQSGRPFPGFSGENLEALERIAIAAEARGSQMVLVLEPGGCPDVLPGCANEESAVGALDAVTALAGDLGLGFFNAREFAAADDWFADSAHFNRAGTRAFTQFMAEELAQWGSAR
jgi:hypothetical protein